MTSAVRRLVVGFAAVATAAATAGSAAVAMAPATSRVTVATSGMQANAPAISDMAVSGNGRYVVFASLASNLVPGDTNGAPDIFMRDRVLGKTTRLSVSPTGAQANAGSYGPLAVSADGRFVVFETAASNISPGTERFYEFMVILDRRTGTYKKLGQVSLYPPSRVAISDDGRYIAYDDPEKDSTLVVRRDLWTGSTQPINPLHYQWPYETLGGMSADGSRVFISAETYRSRGLFVRDFRSGSMWRVDLNNAQLPENRLGRPDAISADGHYALFQSQATNLAAGDTNGATDVFLRNVDLRRTARISLSNSGRQANGTSVGIGVSGSGRYVSFQSNAANLVSGDTNAFIDLFVRDLSSGTTRRCNVATDGTQANASSGYYGAALSRSGLWSAFRSSATNLVPGDTKGYTDVFERGPGC